VNCVIGDIAHCQFSTEFAKKKKIKLLGATREELNNWLFQSLDSYNNYDASNTWWHTWRILDKKIWTWSSDHANPNRDGHHSGFSSWTGIPRFRCQIPRGLYFREIIFIQLFYNIFVTIFSLIPTLYVYFLFLLF